MSVENLPKPVKDYYQTAKMKFVERGNDESFANEAAWNLTLSKFEKTPQGEWVALTKDLGRTKYYTFKMEKAKDFVSRTDDGNVLHNYVLSDIWADGLGTSPTEELLHKWANQINEMMPEVDSDHLLYESIKKKFGGNLSLVQRAMAAKKGIAKAVKAFVDQGKLIVSIMFDKRYENHIDKIRGVSIEAAVESGDGGKWVDGTLFGFTFATNSNPVNPRAVRV